MATKKNKNENYGSAAGTVVGGAIGTAAGGGTPMGTMAGMAIGGALGGTIGGMFGGGDGDISQVPLETKEQASARRALLDYAQTGKWGDFQAGAEVPLGYGDYGMTGLESQGQTALQQLLNGSIPEQYAMGDAALKDALQMDPAKIQAQFDPFRAQVDRQISESNRALKRGAGFAGNLYSTNTIRGLGDIQARGNETMASELARLTDQALARRQAAIPLAYQSAESKQNAKLQQISASQTYGDLTRRLNDAQIKARDAEILRRRQELQLPIEAAKTVAGGGSTFGVPSIPSPDTSPYADLLGMVAQVGGQYYGNKAFSGLTPYSPTPRGGTGAQPGEVTLPGGQGYRGRD